MHKDRQQALNADYLVNSGAAIMIEQERCRKIGRHSFKADRESLIKMAKKARVLC